MREYAEAYVAFLVHFHGTRDYFECHELLEEHWKQEADPALRDVWHGLIQVAVALYHERRGNRAGALKMMGMALRRLAHADMRLAGLEKDRLLVQLRERIAELEGDGESGDKNEAISFRDMALPVADSELLESARRLCADWGYVWGRPSPLEDTELIERHRLRDRNEVMEERARQLAVRADRRLGQEREDT